jgi:hypothetical protein
MSAPRFDIAKFRRRHTDDRTDADIASRRLCGIAQAAAAAKMTTSSWANSPRDGLGASLRAAVFALATLSAVAIATNPAAAQNNPYQFKKEAFKPDGTPWTGPVNVGDVIKYVLSYKPGTTNSGPVTIDDTLSPNQSYLPPTKASDSGWTWGSSPYSIGNHEQYKHPGFGPNTGSVKVTVTGPATPTSGVGDGTIPIPIQSLNKVFGVYHHANSAAEGKIDCWDLASLAKCGTAQPNAISGFLYTPYTPQAVVRGTTIYFLGYRASGVATIGCFDAASNTACADLPLPISVTDKSALAGLIEDSTGRIFAAANDKVFCRLLPGNTDCPGWPAGGFVSVTGAISPSYNQNVQYISIGHGTSATRIYIHHGDARIQCVEISGVPAVCPGSWSAVGTKIVGPNTGIMLSSFPLSGSSGDGGVCLWNQNGSQRGCLTNTGTPISVTPTNLVNPALSSFRLTNSGKVFFPTHGSGGPKCFDYSGITGVACGWTTPTPPPNGLQYGFALDPLGPEKCMLTLGDKNVLWRFDYITGKAGCGTVEAKTPKLEDIYCNGTPTLATFRWTTIRVMTAGADGTLTITKGSGTPASQTITSGTTTYAMPGSIGPGYGQLSFSYTPAAGTPTTVDFEIAYVSDKDPQICYQAVVKTCGGPVFNDAVFKGNFNGAPVNISQRVDLGKAQGPDCPDLTNCIKDSKVKVTCNSDGTFTLTLSGSGFAGTNITMNSETAGVTVIPPQQPWAATTTWTISGATAGQSVTLFANGTKIGGGSEPNTDQCCSGEIKVIMPECPKPPIDVKVEKENTPGGGQGNGFNIWVTNVGAPITFTAGQLTVKDVIPAGYKVITQTSPNWTCLPVPATGPATILCTYNLAGSLGTGVALTDSIVFTGLLTNHEQPLKNCAIVSIAAGVGVDGNQTNDQACVNIEDKKVGELIFTKKVFYEGPILLPVQPYPVTVTCGSSTTTLNLLPNVSQSIGNIPYGTGCSFVEPTPPAPATACPAKKVGVWATVFTPPSSITINAPVINILVANTLTCQPKESLVDLGIKKTGATTPVQRPNYVFDMTVTNIGAAIGSGGTIVVTDTVPANMTFNTMGGSGWACVPPGGPAGTQITCTYGSAAVSGQVLPVIHVDATATGGAPYPPVTNCALVGVATASGLSDTNAANNSSCVTVTKPRICSPPLVANTEGICVQPPPACLPPMVPGPIAGQCMCPQGSVLRGKECVKVTTCQPPMVPGPVAGQCICPQGTVLRGKECVRPIVCKSPLVPNAAGTACGCRPGLVLRQGRCVEPVECRAPATLNSAGTACQCPRGMVAKGNSCIERERPRVDPNDVIRNIPGVFGPGGGGRGQPSSPRDGGKEENPQRR